MPKNFEVSLLELKQHIYQLDVFYERRVTGSTIREMIELAYGRHLTAILKNCIESADLTESELAAQLTHVLENHWTVVRGSFLCYTGHPDSESTRVLLELAHWVCDYKNSQGLCTTLLGLLMPSIKQISTTRPHLDVVYYQEEETTQQPYPIADFRRDIQSVTEIGPFKQILGTHFLSADGESLIPVSLLLELTLDAEKRPLVKPYIPSEKEEDLSAQAIPTHPADPINQRSDSEFNRLINHTALTRDILKAQQDYEAVLSQNVGSLNNALRELGDGLYAGSSHGGEGKALNASEKAYAAIIKFMEYYNRLPPKVVSQIPKDVRHIINKIQTLGSDRSQNDMTKITTNVQTCVGLMGGDIKTQLRLHEKELNKIGVLDLKDPTILKAINEAKLGFSTAKRTLCDAITNQTYTNAVQDEEKTASIDKLEITIAAVQTLGVKAIVDVNPECLMRGGADALKQWMRPLPSEIQALFYREMELYWPSIIQNINDCKNILDFVRGMDATLVPVVLASLENHWPQIIHSLNDFKIIEAYLGDNHLQIKALIHVIRPRLIKWIEVPAQYTLIKKYLSHDEHLAFLGELETQKIALWLAIIKEPFFNRLKPALSISLQNHLYVLRNGLRHLFDDGITILRNRSWQRVEPSVLSDSELRYARCAAEGARVRQNTQFSRQNRFNTTQFDSDGFMLNYVSRFKEPFVNQQMARIESHFITQVDRCEILPFLQALFMAHPWIRKDPSGAIVESFIIDIFIEHLTQNLIDEQGKLRSLGAMTASQLQQNDFRWKAPTADWIHPYAQIYPYTDLSIFRQSLPNYPSLEKHVKHSPENWINHAASRIDVLRYLGGCHPLKMIVNYDGGRQPYLPIKLVLLSELNTLTPVELQNTSCFVINLASEEEPFWIGIQQQPNGHALYIPSHPNADDIRPVIEQAAPDLRRVFPALTFAPISYEHNLALNDFNADLTSKSIWHTILFTRILAAKDTDNPITFREYLPLYMLMQEFYAPNSVSADIFNHFTKRYPYSSNRVTEIKKEGALLTDGIFYKIPASPVTFFETCLECMPSSDERTYTLKAKRPLDRQSLVTVLYILHHSPQIQTLILPAGAVDGELESSTKGLLQDLLDTNPNLLKVGTADAKRLFSPFYRYLECIAARNRFLQTVHIERMDMRTSIAERKKLWADAGQQLLRHFQDSTASINSRDLRRMDAGGHLDVDGLSKSQRIMRQWQAMGILGVGQLFNAIDASPAEAPNLHVTFDLRASNVDKPFQEPNQRFITALTKRIQSYKGKAPLFQSVSLILPDSMDEALINEWYKLVESIKKQLHANHERPNELFLYHVKYENVRQILKPFIITKTTPDVMRHPLPRIVEWDEMAHLSKDARSAKNDYRDVQNDGLKLWRQYSSEAPVEAMRSTVTLLEKKQLPPTILLTNLRKEETLPWGSQEVWTPLVEDFGTQIQVEMEQEQQHHVTAIYETKPVLRDEAPPIVVTPIVLFYNKPREILITRDNIDKDPRFLTWWNGLSPAQQAHYGGSGKALFSLLFGQKQAEHLIAQVEFSALERLFPHMPQLLGGFDRDNCMAGFELALNKPKMIGARRVRDIVLCFDSEKEKIALADYASKKPGERNPYTTLLTLPPKVNCFLGDFRQFATLSLDTFVQQTLYQFLVTQEPNELGLESDANLILGERALCLEFLKEWVNDNALDCLFDTEHEAHLTTDNLKSLGQLFYKYGSQQGLRNFFHLAHQIIEKEHFDEAGLIHWKRYLLDPNPNWSSCLEKEELEAVTLSMSTLKGNRTAQTIWWLLVEAHSKTVGYTTYSALWYAYQKCLGYVSERQLTFDVDVIARVLRETSPFNAPLFLEKLHALLHCHAKTLDGHELSQQLLNHLQPSDLECDGPLYAILYEHYPYTHQSLKLTHLTTTSKGVPSTYVVSWKPNEVLMDPIAHSLRYACRSGRLYHHELSALEGQLETHFRPILKDPNGIQVLRLYIGCVTTGGTEPLPSGSGKPLANARGTEASDVRAVLNLDPEILSFINRGMTLPEVVQKNSMKLDWHDIVTLANAISELDLLSLLENLTDFEAVAFINACGRAIQCYRYHAPQGSNGLHALLDTIKTQTVQASDVIEESKEEDALQEFKASDSDSEPQPDWDHPLLQHYPWLITDALGHLNGLRWDESIPETQMSQEQIQCLMLQKQLSTLNFKDTRYLPGLIELQNAVKQIQTAADPESTRRHIMSSWVKMGLQMTLRDTKYSPLTENEITDAMVYLDNHLEPNFKAQNKALCKRFLEGHLALPTKGNRQDEMLMLLEKLCNQLDNKKHYNELGVILGHLIQRAKPIDETHSQKWYSAKQLTDILPLLIHPDTYKTYHYPFNLLDIILTAPIAHTLLSSDLNQLEQALKPADLRNYIQDLTDNKTMSMACKEIAMEYATRGESNECRVNAELAKDLLTALSKDARLKSSYLDMLNQRLKEHRLQAQDYATWQQKHVVAFRLVTEESMQSFWQDMQIKWETQLSEPIRALFIPPVNKTQIYIQMILVQVLSQKELASDAADLRNQLLSVKALLSTWDPEQLEQIITYSASDHRLTLGALHVLFTDFKSLFVPKEKPWQSLLKERDEILGEVAPPPPRFSANHAMSVVHFFESVFMARGKAMRNYSLHADEQLGLLRVLSSIKRKKTGYLSAVEVNQCMALLGYCNAFAIGERLDEMKDTALKDLARGLARKLKNRVPEADRLYIKMQMLACIREMNLRKKSIWNNHSQMVALIYLAIHGDDIGIIQKIATGEGKSVVTPQRAIYLALFGKTVDIISAKDILSERDSERDANLIKAFGFPVSHHITPSSPTKEYQNTDGEGGAIHYFNLGNFALFLCEVVASRHESFHLYSDNRVALLDEADYQLLDELMLQYNYAKPQANAGVYNYDEWVFRAVCMFYIANTQMDNQETTFRTNESGQLCISNLRHLKPLCEQIQALSITAPKQSLFIQQTLIPAVNGQPHAMQELERVLRQHLSACHSAYALELDKNYYIGPATRKVGDKVLNIRFPYVMIDSQPKEDSTYCNGTHQYLQTRLALEAAAKGETPDFFVDPLSDILFTLNPVSVLNTLFEKREGSTGTPGSDYELTHYRAAYQIQEVVKMPTHRLSNSTRLPILFAKNKDEKIAYIAAQIIANQDRPFLIDCDNDADVKILSKAIGTVCQALDEDYQVQEHFIVDTLDTGKSEASILDQAGKNGSVLFSARVGRGTDVQCEHEEGLFVVEAGEKPKRKSKQVRGRQARHGDKGTVQAIIDFESIQIQYDDWMRSPFKLKLEEVIEECRDHLGKKIAKHAKDNTGFWRAFDEPAYQEQCLKTEVVETFKYRLNQEKVMRDAERNTLISNLSLDVTRVISRLNRDSKNHANIEQLVYGFSKLLIEIKELWNKHQRTALSGDEQRLAFLQALNGHWIAFCDAFADCDFDKNAIQQKIQAHQAIHTRPMATETPPNREPEITPATDLFNMVMSLLLERLGESFNHYVHEAHSRRSILGNTLEMPYYADLAAYIGDLQGLMDDPHRQKEIEDLLITTLEIMNENTFFSVSFKLHRDILEQYEEVLDESHGQLVESNERDTRPHILWLQGLSALFKQPLLGQKPAGARTDQERLFMTQLTALLVDIITKKYCYDSEALDFADDPSILFIETLSKELSRRFSIESLPQMNPLMGRVGLLLTRDKTVTSLMTRHLLMSNRLPYIVQVLSQDNCGDFETRMEVFQGYLLKQENQLEDYPGVIPLLFDIVFRNDEQGELNATDLPDIRPACFGEHDEAQSVTDFWTILAKHAPSSKQDRDTFIDALAIYEKAQDRKNLLKALNKIPAPVRLSHMTDLIRNPIPTNVKDILANIRLYTKQSNIWFEALKAKDLIRANGPFWRPNFERKAEYQNLSDVFHRLTPEDSEYFFGNPTFCSLAPSEMQLLAMTFLTDNRLERPELDAICDLLKDIKASPSPHQATLEALFKDGLSNNPKGLYQDINRFKHFMKALDTLPNQLPIDNTTITHLWNKWQTEGIPEFIDLERVVSVLRTMQRHASNPRQMNQFFNIHASHSIIEERIFLMQCLEQDLVHLAPRDRENAYYEKLERLVRQHTEPHQDNHMPQQQQSYFRNVLHIIQQLFRMAQPLFTRPVADVANPNPLGWMEADDAFVLNDIQKAKSAYDYSFFQSRSRAMMASKFFSEIEDIATRLGRTEIHIIDRILQVKQEIMSEAGNKSTWSFLGRGPIDSKGHSRLYKITSGLLSSVIQHYLDKIALEPDLEKKLAARKELYLRLEAHYIQEMDQLISKLRAVDKCLDLSSLLREIKSGLESEHRLTEVQSSRLNQLIHASKKETPAYLHYILDEMLVLCQFADEPPGPTPPI